MEFCQHFLQLVLVKDFCYLGSAIGRLAVALLHAIFFSDRDFNWTQ
jgi:hypothetical protein